MATPNASSDGLWLLNSSRRDRIFLASKFASDEITAARAIEAVDASRSRLQTDMIDLYYVHWPRTDKDLRPLMEGLETATAGQNSSDWCE